MATEPADTSIPPRKPSREEAFAIAERRKAARQRRTSRIRRAIVVLGVAAFIGPFGVIYAQLASGHDPQLGNNTNVANVAASTSDASTSSGSSTSDSTSTTTSNDSTQTTTSAPATVTTQQS